jgi:peptidoglycan/LPS O-acetylase OafA/YrhL
LLSPRHLAFLCGLLIAVGITFRAAMVAMTGNYILADASLPGCVDALAVGALLSTLRYIQPRMVILNQPRPILLGGCLAALLIIAAGWFTDWRYAEPAAWIQGWPAVMWQALMLGILLASVCLIALCANGDMTPPAVQMRRILSWKPMVHIGKISYGLYLYHPLCNYFVFNGWLRAGFSTSYNYNVWFIGVLQLAFTLCDRAHFI